nr:uncharacterized protein LOC127348489 [Lolium perenne]
MPTPTQAKTPMDAAKKVVVTTYEELPRRRHGSHGATSSTAARAKASGPTRAAVGGGYNRRAMLLAYAQHLRRRGGGQRSASVPRALGWGEWKRADPGAGSDDGDRKVVMGRIRRSWCSRFRLWVRLWIATFFRRVQTIRENASCKRGD